MELHTIPTERLLLRMMTPEVYDHVFGNYSDSELKQFYGLKNDSELQEKKLMHQNGLIMFNKTFRYFQLIRKNDGANIGWCGFHTWYQKHFRAEIGYVLSDEAERKKGYMKEALAVVIRHGFTEMNLQRVEAYIGPTNIPSIKLVENLGFIQEGNLRQHYFTNGQLEDSLLFALLKQDYKTID